MEEPINELDFQGFPLGLDTTTKLGALGPSGLRKLLGMTPDDDGGLHHAGNFRTIVPNTYHVFTMHRWSYGANKRLLFITTDSANANTILVWNEATGLLDRTIALPYMGLVGTGTTVGRFLQAGLNGDVFLLAGTDTLSHLFWIKDPLTTVTANDISVVVEASTGYPDSQVVSGTPDGAGVLNSTGYALYQWSISLTNSDGRKSQVSLPSPPTAFNDEKAKISFGIAPVDLAAAITAGRIVSLDLFRIGGKASQLRFVKTVQLAVVAGVIVDAITGVEIEDNVSEEELSFIFATTYQDPAPVGLTDITLHQSKIFGIKDTGLYFSRTNDFLYWGFDDNGVDDDGGVIYPDNNTADSFNGLTSEGSLLILGRVQTVYALYGSSLTNSGGQGFAFDQRANFGNHNRLSLCRSDNDAYFLGRDDLLHTLRDISSPSVSQRIKTTLKSLVDTDIHRAVMGHHNGQIYLSLPVATGTLSPGICLVFDTTRGIWREATDSRLNSVFLISQPSPVNGELELLSAARTGGIYACETYNDGTSGTERKISITTDQLNFPSEMVGRFSAILIEGTMVNSGTDPMIATLTAGGVSKTYPLVQSGNRLLYYVSLPADLNGQFVQFSLNGSLLAGEIRRISIGTIALRRSS